MDVRKGGVDEGGRGEEGEGGRGEEGEGDRRGGDKEVKCVGSRERWRGETKGEEDFSTPLFITSATASKELYCFPNPSIFPPPPTFSSCSPSAISSKDLQDP